MIGSGKETGALAEAVKAPVVATAVATGLATGLATGAAPSRRSRCAALATALVAALATLIAGSPAQAATAEVRITPDSDLDFGSFMVFGSGARTISPAGTVTDTSIASLEGRLPSPARFTITYDRGNESRHVLDIELEVVMSAAPRVRIDGVEASLSAFRTDLPGAPAIAPGQVIRLTLPNCRSRICSRSFQLGARLDVTRSYGGAQVLIPIPMDVTVISAERQSR